MSKYKADEYDRLNLDLIASIKRTYAKISDFYYAAELEGVMAMPVFYTIIRGQHTHKLKIEAIEDGARRLGLTINEGESAKRGYLISDIETWKTKYIELKLQHEALIKTNQEITEKLETLRQLFEKTKESF